MTSTDGVQTYDTHDNGGRPFRVKIAKDDTVTVYSILPDSEYYAQQPSVTVRGKAFVGLSPLDGPDFDGNTILVQTGNLEYIYIGGKIFKFKTLAPITKYNSPVGNNDVPYPYAIDSEGRVYLMLESVILTGNGDAALEDPYKEYWFNNRQSSGRGVEKMTIVNTICENPYKEHWFNNRQNSGRGVEK
eukprot:TRINITY_DN6934_c0_g1_i1.p1 TRINITY_DN6934_c0_g1~~TRINITY_DN6934_c0_g1_i1.p1  ORF type:complete len:217 (-),score=43.06 TRINITY_DN6934_c0_g1_i1:33-596(-)